MSNYHYMWWDLGKSVWNRTCDIFSFLWMKFLFEEANFAEKPTWTGLVPMLWAILRTIENKRNQFLFLAISQNQCSRLPTDSARSQHIEVYFSTFWTLVRSMKVVDPSFPSPTIPMCVRHFLKLWDYLPWLPCMKCQTHNYMEHKINNRANLRVIVQDQWLLTTTALCSTSRLHMMSHMVDCEFQASYRTIKRACSIWNCGKTCAFYACSSGIRNLPRVTSRLISNLDRE